MADVKNIITLGIGANPGGLVWFFTSGLVNTGVANVPGCAAISTSLVGAATLTLALAGTAAKSETLVGTATKTEKQCTL